MLGLSARVCPRILPWRWNPHAEATAFSKHSLTRGRVLGPHPSHANPVYTSWVSWSGLLAVTVWDRMPDMLCDGVMGSHTS